MKRIFVALALSLFLVHPAFATSGTDKQVDAIQNSTGGALLAVPSLGVTLLSDTNVVTVSGKTLDGGSNTFTNIPISSLGTGTSLSVGQGGTGLATITTNGMIYGNGASPVGVTAAGVQYAVFQAGASGVPTIGAVNLASIFAVTNQLAVGNGGTGAGTFTAHNVLLGEGTSAISSTSPSTAGYVLTSNGTSADPTFQAVSGSTPALNGGSSSPQSVTAGGGITLTGIGILNYVWVVGSGGPVVVTATPSITACTADGQTLHVIATSATNTVKLQDSGTLASSGLSQNGPWVGGGTGLPSDITYHCDMALSEWVEDNRVN